MPLIAGLQLRAKPGLSSLHAGQPRWRYLASIAEVGHAGWHRGESAGGSSAIVHWAEALGKVHLTSHILGQRRPGNVSQLLDAHLHCTGSAKALLKQYVSAALMQSLQHTFRLFISLKKHFTRFPFWHTSSKCGQPAISVVLTSASQSSSYAMRLAFLCSTAPGIAWLEL